VGGLYAPEQFMQQSCLQGGRPAGSFIDTPTLMPTQPTTDTEGKLSVPRMQEIALARAARIFAEQQQQQQQQQQSGPTPPPTQQSQLEELALSALDRVLIVKAGTLDALKDALTALERQVPQRGARLVILDSVAALLRSELGNGRGQVGGWIDGGETGSEGGYLRA